MFVLIYTSTYQMKAYDVMHIMQRLSREINYAYRKCSVEDNVFFSILCSTGSSGCGAVEKTAIEKEGTLRTTKQIGDILARNKAFNSGK